MTDIKKQWKRNSSLIIDLGAIRHNLSAIKARLKPATKLMPVLKADAYGHGSVELATAIAEEADWFAVNDVEEGIELRNAGIELPILVFGVPDVEIAELYSGYSLTATISDLTHFDLLTAGTEYHLNVDTGMGRLGLSPGEIEGALSRMDSHTELICTGIYSHFATSAEPGSPKVLEQLHIFREVRSAFPGSLLTHVSNTGASFFYDDVDFDMIRTGIGMYGYPPGETVIEDLQPALEWHSHLVQVNAIKKGATVSYGAKWKAPDDGFIGIIPVGYEDGLRRSLSGRIGFNIENKRYPQVGTITMNYCMIWLGDKQFETGTEVELWNKQITAQDWAKLLGTIPYEILTGIDEKIPRIFID